MSRELAFELSGQVPAAWSTPWEETLAGVCDAEQADLQGRVREAEIPCGKVQGRPEGMTSKRWKGTQ